MLTAPADGWSVSARIPEPEGREPRATTRECAAPLSPSTGNNGADNARPTSAGAPAIDPPGRSGGPLGAPLRIELARSGDPLRLLSERGVESSGTFLRAEAELGLEVYGLPRTEPIT